MYALADPISDLLEQPIPERSVNAMLHCPFHEDRTPSFSIHLEEGVWHCFSCQESGTLKTLYRRLGKGVDDNVRLYQAKKDAQEPDEEHYTDFTPQANRCLRDLRGEDESGRLFLHDFLASRHIRKSTARTFGIGWDKERDALAFPYVDTADKVTGIKYRYRNGFKASETGSRYGLYGVNEATGRDAVIVCEGESDTLRVHSQYGDRYGVCGTSGASVSPTQWTKFSLHFVFASRIYLLYDGDAAGDKCVENALSVLGGERFFKLRPPDGYDASDFLQSGGSLEELGLE